MTNGDSTVLVESTLGRFLFNEAFPSDYPFHDAPVKKRDLTELASKLVELYPCAVVAESLDTLKDLGFEFATRSGLTISIADVRTPAGKAALLEKFEAEADKVEGQYERGVITDDERRQKEIEVWSEATARVRDAMQEEMRSTKFNPIEMMVGSGARGNVMQVQQIAGMRGLVANPRGEIIPRPIKSNFREGLSVLEYFISTHGARKGLADTALRTADSGYLTRRLVDVAQEVIVREDDCGSPRGIWIEDVDDDPETMRILDTKLLGRCLTDDVKLADGSVMPRNTEVREAEVRTLAADPGVTRVRVRSVLTCDSITGVCMSCYGTMLATNKLVDQGEAVGIIAAQSIGEPGTQLTMRTFHTGGIAGEDITHGLPRVVELFEARTPKGAAVMAESSGIVRLGENEKGERVLTIVADDGTEEEHAVTRRTHLYPGIADGVEVSAGQQLTGDHKTPLDPKKILEVKGIRATQQYLSDEVQKVYREQGVSIHDKHVEVIVRQMLRRVGVSEAGDSTYLPGQKADAREFAERNRLMVEEGKAARRGSSRAHGHHEGVAGHRLVAVGGVVPGDHPRAHRGGHRGPSRRAHGPQGERDHRQADPGGYGDAALPRHRDPRPRLRAPALLLVRHRPRRRPRPRRLAGRHQRRVGRHAARASAWPGSPRPSVWSTRRRVPSSRRRPSRWPRPRTGSWSPTSSSTSRSSSPPARSSWGTPPSPDPGGSGPALRGARLPPLSCSVGLAAPFSGPQPPERTTMQHPISPHHLRRATRAPSVRGEQCPPSSSSSARDGRPSRRSRRPPR